MIIGTAEQVREEIERTADLNRGDEVTIIPNFFGANNRVEGITLLAQFFGLR